MCLRLKSIDYLQYSEKPNQWSLDGLELGAVNLLVGKNATGKSRTLSIINSLSRILRGTQSLSEGRFSAVFNSGADGVFRYTLEIVDSKVVSEQLLVDGEVKLERSGGTLRVYAEQIGDFLIFEPSSDEIAAHARSDKLQHPFLRSLGEWADSVRHYNFGGPMGRNALAVPVKEDVVLDDRDGNTVVAIFAAAAKRFPGVFAERVTGDLKKIGFQVDRVETSVNSDISINIDDKATHPIVISIVEQGNSHSVPQHEISQGMFRAFSILAQLHFASLSKRASCIIIDDIGEGLDFARSTQLIEVIRERSIEAGFQLIMSTNDKFVMNHVPLDEWSVLVREGSELSVKNSKNSKDQFEEFRYAGLSNFSFFEMDFVNSSPAENIDE